MVEGTNFKSGAMKHEKAGGDSIFYDFSFLLARTGLVSWRSAAGSSNWQQAVAIGVSGWQRAVQ